jgi:hypothetical protein
MIESLETDLFFPVLLHSNHVICGFNGGALDLGAHNAVTRKDRRHWVHALQNWQQLKPAPRAAAVQLKSL